MKRLLKQTESWAWFIDGLKILTRKVYLIIYKGFIRPHLEAGVCNTSMVPQKTAHIWKGTLNTWKKYNEGRRSCSKLSYEQRLRKLNLTTLRTRRQRGDLIEAYKIITRKENIKSENFFHIYSNGYYTTGHCFKLIATTMVLYLITMLPLSRLELRRNFFSQRVVSNWNSLSVHVIEELFQNPVMPLFGIVFGVLRKLLLQNSLSPPNTIPKSGMTRFWNLALQIVSLLHSTVRCIASWNCICHLGLNLLPHCSLTVSQK